MWVSYMIPYIVINTLLRLCSLSAQIGAGTGYWASQILSSGATSVIAVDCAPPDRSPNDYHGRAPAHAAIRPGGPEAAGEHSRVCDVGWGGVQRYRRLYCVCERG